MKKIILIIAFCISLNTFAQKIETGFKAGVNFSSFTTTKSWVGAYANSLTGINAGCFFSWFFDKNFALQTEALFSAQGIGFSDAYTREDLHLYYLNFPVLLKGRFDGGFYAEFGPQFGLYLSQSTKTIDLMAKRTDLSATIGAGFQSKVGLGIGARYTAGVFQAGDYKPGIGINPVYKNEVLQINIYYTLFNNRNTITKEN